MASARGAIRTILIANRGEIACRIIRTARDLGIKTVAVYSDADAHSLHVAMADDAVRIGPPPAQDSYLNIAAVLDAARAAGADAIHPGYGFLSENAAFAEACATAGLKFIGPPAAAIRAMGDKGEAKALMAKAGVPLVPGYHGSDQQADHLSKQATALGFPLLIKASAGGGGRGMRIVRTADDFAPALAAARREAQAAFGDDRVILEAFIEQSRHIEVQIFADGHGNVVHLFDRDCSLQRRYQKIVEEAPAPNLAVSISEKMRAAAIAAARAVVYEGAGTVEFILAPDGRFFFLEMNTRLQVEHTVTESITGHDLVAWQFAVAAGEPLPASQDEIQCRGHAIEVRLYAEDPASGFLPAAGRLEYLRLPATDDTIRVDAGVRSGDEISIHYDPMLAKIIAYGGDRPQATDRLRQALAGVRVAGITTNLDFLARLLDHGSFAAAQIDTGFIGREGAALVPTTATATPEDLCLVALFLLDERRSTTAPDAVSSQDKNSPWAQADGWRLNGPATQELRFTEGPHEHNICATYQPDPNSHWLLDRAGERLACRLIALAGYEITARIGQAQHQATIVPTADTIFLLGDGRQLSFGRIDRFAATGQVDQTVGALVSPMPGHIIRLHVATGDKVRRGQVLIVLEAMKMEHMIVAPADGVVAQLRCATGDQVAEATELLRLEEA